MQFVKKYFADPVSIPEQLAGKHMTSVDGLRGISILMVIAAHINAHYGIPVLSALFGAGIVGVYMFFVISGFLITTLLVKEKIQTGGVSLRKFYTRRTLRIFPLAYLYIGVIAVIQVIYNLDIPASDFIYTSLYLVNFAQFIKVSYFFNHFWSLAVEEQFYLFIAPLMKLRLVVLKWMVLLTIPITLLIRYWLSHHPENVYARFGFDLTRCMDGLAIGSFFSLLIFSDLIGWKGLLAKRVWLSPLLLVLIIVLKTDVETGYLKPFFNHTFYSFLVGLLLIINIVPSTDWFYKLLNTRVLAYVGLLSYSLYIWQQLFTSAIFLHLSPWNVLCIPVVAILSYHYFEKFFLAFKKKFAVVNT